jgi:hypothetical protein
MAHVRHGVPDTTAPHASTVWITSCTLAVSRRTGRYGRPGTRHQTRDLPWGEPGVGCARVVLPIEVRAAFRSALKEGSS